MRTSFVLHRNISSGRSSKTGVGTLIYRGFFVSHRSKIFINMQMKCVDHFAHEKTCEVPVGHMRVGIIAAQSLPC